MRHTVISPDANVPEEDIRFWLSSHRWRFLAMATLAAAMVFIAWVIIPAIAINARSPEGAAFMLLVIAFALFMAIATGYYNWTDKHVELVNKRNWVLYVPEGNVWDFYKTARDLVETLPADAQPERRRWLFAMTRQLVGDEEALDKIDATEDAEAFEQGADAIATAISGALEALRQMQPAPTEEGK